MNRDELVRKVAEKLDYPREDVHHIISGTLDLITQTLTQGKSVSLTGFGKFYTDIRGSRRAANPRNPNEHIIIPEMRVPKFRSGHRLKTSVREKGK